MKITIEDGGRSVEVLDISTDTSEGYRVALQEGDAEFLHIVPSGSLVETLVNRWLSFPDFAFGPLRFKAS